MTGHIRQRSPGAWEIRYRIAGKVRTATFRGGKRDAERELRRRLADADRGIAAEAPASLTTAGWLTQWLEMARADIRPITLDRYESAVRLYLIARARHDPTARLVAARHSGCLHGLGNCPAGIAGAAGWPGRPSGFCARPYTPRCNAPSNWS